MSSLPNFRLGSLFSRKPGLRIQPAQSPGSLIHIGERRTEQLVISAAEFDADHIEIRELHDFSELPLENDPTKVTWIHVSGLHDIGQIAKLGALYGIHPLILEDILNTNSHSKFEDHDGHIFIVNRMLSFNSANAEVDVQHSALLLLPGNILLTFLEGPTEVFAPIYARLKTGGAGRIRNHGADYLAWAIIDAVVDNYFHVIDGVLDTLNRMEDTLQDDASDVEAGDLFSLKKEVSALHRMVRPVRDIATALQHSDCPVLTPAVRPYLRDLSDHSHQVREAIDELRDSAASLRDFYLTIASNRMNEVMKVLTCFSTVFLPLTFLAGIYGMNFDVLPELHLKWAYFALWALFAVIAAGMFVLFRKKKWL